MATEGLQGYYPHVQDKTYIDKYPASIISLDELQGKSLLEIGAGTLNDMVILIQKQIVQPESIFISEPFIPAFCDSLDKIEAVCHDDLYAFKNKHRISFRPIPNPEFPDLCVHFVYANNVLHSLGYQSLEDELELRIYRKVGSKVPDEIKQERIKQLSRSPAERVQEIVKEAYRLLQPGGIFFVRNLTSSVN